MNKRGFTLLELVGVLVILSLLMLLVFPKLINLIKSSNDTKDDITKNLIYMSVDNYIKDRKDEFLKVDNITYCVTIKNLVDSTDLNEPLELDGESIIDTKSVQITYNKGFKYEIVDKEDCAEPVILCTAKDEATLGNLPTGEYNYGDEYICDVGESADSKNLTFYVLDKDENTVSLILGTNYDDTVLSWCDQSGENPSNNSCSADGLIAKINEIKGKWNRVTGGNEVLIPTGHQIAISSGDSAWKENNYTGSELSKWLWGGLSNTKAPYGYWTGTPNTSNTNNAWIVNQHGEIGEDNVDYQDGNGIRPVIKILKLTIKNN